MGKGCAILTPLTREAVKESDNDRIVTPLALCMVLGCMIPGVPAWAQTPNLSGEWEAPFTVGTDSPQPLQLEDVGIQQSGNTIQEHIS